MAVAAVDCVENEAFCHDMKVQTFPTLRFYHHGEQVNEGEYRFDRTVAALTDFVTRKLESENIYRQYPEARVAHAANWNTDHPGCLVSGFLLVNRVPGNFHVMAHSRHHSLNTLRTNLSHTVHHLSFGVPLTDAQHRKLATIDVRHARTDTLDGEDYYHDDYHYAYQHFVHIVPTKYNLGVFWRDRFAAFQTLHSHHLLKYAEHVPPEARFSSFVATRRFAVQPARALTCLLNAVQHGCVRCVDGLSSWTTTVSFVALASVSARILLKASLAASSRRWAAADFSAKPERSIRSNKQPKP
mgnify:CR=1 FL=1